LAQASLLAQPLSLQVLLQGATDRVGHGCAIVNEVGGKRWQPFVKPISPPVCERNILAVVNHVIFAPSVGVAVNGSCSLEDVPPRDEIACCAPRH
jgi:hypothetical protein